MSFSQDVREELMKHYSRQVHCRKAELAALIMFAGRDLTLDGGNGKYIYNDPRGEDSHKVIDIGGVLDPGTDLVKLISRTDDKRAFLRGAFISSGTISDPRKDYHFEIACPDESAALLVTSLFEIFDIKAKVTAGHSQRHVVYFKGNENISLALNVMEATQSMMEFENIHIERELRGAVNRRVNCDTANINKSIAAGARQIEDIELIMSWPGFDELEPGLREICSLRIDNPDATLAELADMAEPKISKSGVNHRLRKISKMAEEIRSRQISTEE